MTFPYQIYPGYKDKDLDMLRSFVVQQAILENDMYIDGFSQKTKYETVPFCDNFSPEHLTFPLPDDGCHAEVVEYIALCDSIRHANSSYCAVELGAGWGPWITLGGVIARSRGIKNINLIGVEAQPERFLLMKNHLQLNELRPVTDENITEMNGIRSRLIQGAVSVKNQNLWFPIVDIGDMGSTTATTNTSSDYRGLPVKNFSVEGFTLEQIIGDTNVDYLHIDIQGQEFEVIKSAISTLNTHVKAIFVGTHSRIIEGKLIELLYKNRWMLINEKPCRVEWIGSPPSIEAMTKFDGCQYWRR